MGRIVWTRPTTLVAMLSIRTGEPPAPPEWFVRVQEDLHFAWKTVALLASAPPPDLEAPFWVGVMRDKERWAQTVKICAFSCNEEDGCSSVEQGLRLQCLQQEVRF